MAEDIAIKVQGLSKRYVLGQAKEDNLRGALSRMLRRRSSRKEEFLALKDLNFEINRGEVIGIIGNNGAGKSTLLKILSQITKPSEGRIEINGRMASLLEVGTGFHPELTGRENVFLNGTILGMTRKEVKSKFDAIVEFSGVSKFIDTPVKHYSSGMYVRLAFAVAAHLDPEILVIDEVLAVGDASFQKKCLGKMKDVANEGRTVLFVSHNISAINSLCSKCIYLNEGKMEMYDTTEKVVSHYLNSCDFNTYKVAFSKNERPGDEVAKVASISLIDKKGLPIDAISVETTFGIKINYEVLDNELYNPIPNVHFVTSQGEHAFVSVEGNSKEEVIAAGAYEAVVWIPSHLLNTGFYTIDVALSSLSPSTLHCFLQGALGFEVIENMGERDNDYKQEIPGVVRPKLVWETHKI